MNVLRRSTKISSTDGARDVDQRPKCDDVHMSAVRVSVALRLNTRASSAVECSASRTGLVAQHQCLVLPSRANGFHCTRECSGSAPVAKAKTVDEALRHVQLYEDTYGRFDFTDAQRSDAAADRQDGCFYLDRVDAMGVRSYIRHETTKSVRIIKEPDRFVTRIELLQETMNDNILPEILAAVEPGRIHVFTSACENFCLGGALAVRST